MIRFFVILILLSASWGAWLFKERPKFLLDVALGEWSMVRNWLNPSEAMPTPSDTPIGALPFIAENRAASTVFQPHLRDFAPHLSVPTAHAAIILDGETGRELYSQNAHQKRQVASLTKLFTALIVAEQVADLDSLVTLDEDMLYVDGTKVGCPRSGFCNSTRLKMGEQLAVRDLLKAALMNSANDAATALGKYVGGTASGFADMMNRRASTLGLTDSHFCTPSGLEIDGRESECYSSAADMAKIAEASLQYPVLWEIMQLKETTITSHDGTLEHELFNTNQLLGNMPNLVGTKTGFTPLAGYSLLAVAHHPNGGHPVIAVVLNDPYRWESIQSMFSWSFQAYDWI